MLRISPNHFVEGVSVQPTPNKSGALKPRLIIVHDTAGALDYKGSVSWLRNPQAKASAHFVVGRKGEIVQLASCAVKTWHAGKSIYKGKSNVNDFAIGIEIANPGKLTLTEANARSARAGFGAFFDVKQYNLAFAETPHHGKGWWMPYPQAQLNAVLDICMALREAYDITEVAPHWLISPGRKIDTNPLFPLTWLQAKLKGREDVHDSFDCRLAKGAIIRAWPSFNSANILNHVENEVLADIQRSGTYTPTGDSIPPQVPTEKPILWYNVNVAGSTENGWVPFTDVELL
jgi:N-acetylmuramoyl-L-alanine amidase